MILRVGFCIMNWDVILTQKYLFFCHLILKVFFHNVNPNKRPTIYLGLANFFKFSKLCGYCPSCCEERQIYMTIATS